VGAAAIIYMFVEPAYRKRGLGELALEVISVIHSVQGCDFTMMVCDDKGSGKLIKWYESHGYKQAPKLQALLGSPNKEYGTTMLSKTQLGIDPAVRLKWW
jgi:GNAT superfamily N-acetyltransferase